MRLFCARNCVDSRCNGKRRSRPDVTYNVQDSSQSVAVCSFLPVSPPSHSHRQSPQVMDSAEVRRRIRREFELHSVTLRVDALTLATECCAGKTTENIREYVKRIVDRLIDEKLEEQVVGLEVLKLCHARMTRGKNIENADVFKVIHAQEWKRMVLDPATRSFKEVERKEQNAEHGRFDLIKEFLKTPDVLPIELLYSRNDTIVTVLGMLRRNSMDTYGVEDPTGSLKINLTSATFSNGIFYEGGIYLFNGRYKDNILNVETVKLPEVETVLRTDNRRFDLWKHSDMIPVLSDVHLDDPIVLRKLNILMKGFLNTPPYAFIFCGSFLSPTATTDPIKATDDGFRHLSNIISQYQSQFANTQFVFVPMSQDWPTGNVVPRSPPAAQTDHFSQFPNVHFASNPCKLQCRDTSIVIFRDDGISKACNNSIQVSNDTTQIPQHYVDTIKSQKHFSPLPTNIAPVRHMYDYLFQLCPEPDVLILADNHKQYFISEKLTTRPFIFNPGSFSTSERYRFLVFNPIDNTTDVSEIPI